MRNLDFFYMIGSTYTYLTVIRIDNIAKDAGVVVNWRPFNVREIMVEQKNIPFVGKPVKMRYMWRDLERRANRHGIPFGTIPPYPVDRDTLAGRIAVVAKSQDWCPQFTKEIYRAWFLEHRVPGEIENMKTILKHLDKDPGEIIELANSKATRASYADETDVARQMGIFGSPTFVINDEIFWGDDRLEEALDWLRD